MIKLIKYIINATIDGFLFIINTICSGIYTYLIGFFKFLNTIFKNKFDKPLNKLYGKQKPAAVLLIIIYVFSFTAIFNMVYSPSNEGVKHDKVLKDDGEKEIAVKDKPEAKEESVLDNNLFRRFGKMSLDQVDFSDLRGQNSDTVAWISIDGTNVNYPVVQANDNEFYLDHSFTKEYNNNGWVFMDFRNSPMQDNNTIFYGHNLLNKTSFGSVSNLFTKSWKKNSTRTIVVLTPEKQYVYKVFSVYYSDPVISYLQVEFDSTEEYSGWLNNLANQDSMGLGEKVSSNDKIITLSTCTEDNKGRKVVHAKLISEKAR